MPSTPLPREACPTVPHLCPDIARQGLTAGRRLQARWRAPVRLVSLVALAALGLSACGGGLSLYVDGSDHEGWPPSVSLATAQGSVPAGQSVRLVAAASDESGIESVAFYRVDDGVAVLLGTDGGEPFEWAAVAPLDGRDAMLLFARATDGAGNHADSNTVTVLVTP